MITPTIWSRKSKVARAVEAVLQFAVVVGFFAWFAWHALTAISEGRI
jgi:hypothetical protein